MFTIYVVVYDKASLVIEIPVFFKQSTMQFGMTNAAIMRLIIYPPLNNNDMAKHGPLLILEDDEDDREIYVNVLKEMGMRNEIFFFDAGDALLTYLQTTTDRPMIIIADINVPRMNGLELRRQINLDERLRKKSIPFVFLTTIESREIVDEVYDLTVQGYFIKKPFYDDIARQIRTVLEYWLIARHPNQ